MWGKRAKVVVADYAVVIAAVLVIALLVGGALTYTTNVEPGTETEERTVSEWRSVGGYTHSSTVQTENRVFDVGETLEDRSLYYTQLGPELDGQFRYGFEAPSGELTVETTTTLVTRSVSEGDGGNTEELWRIEEPLGTTTETLAPGELATTPFTVNVTEVLADIEGVREDLGASPGQTSVSIVSTVEATGTAAGADATDTMYLNIGPHHPATHGVLHVGVTLDGEQVADVEPDIGYIHRCEEQMCEQGTYRHQIMPYPDRWDWSGAGLCNEWAYARVAEDLADIDVPEYAQVIRTMSAELSRMLAHFLAVGTYALDVVGEFTAAFMYGIEDRERVQSLLEDLTGQRLMFNYFRLGGVAWDLPEPREEFFDETRAFLDRIPRKLAEYHDLLTENEVFQMRTVDTGTLPPETAREYGVTGPVARGSGIDYDIRRDDPYGYYDELDWSVATEDGCDNFSRVLVRLREVEESARIVEQCVDLLEEWPDEDRTIQANVPRTLRPDPDTEIYRAVEGAKGELGIYIRSDGTDKPARFKIRGPSFSNLSALPEMAEGEYVPDLIATLGSLDTIMGEVDR